jgi:hypothetical protein
LITASDFICLPYTPDLTEAGISYACRLLPHTYPAAGSSPFDRLRRIVADVSVELAFRRYLTQQRIPFDIKGATPFSEPDRYDVSLGGHRCDIKSFLISYRGQIVSLHSHPEQLLEAPALVPSDQHVSDGQSPADLYLFCFLTGLVADSPDDVQKASGAGQPLHWIHAMPAAWVRPHAWLPLGPLALKSESQVPVILEIGGQDATRNFITRSVELVSHTRAQVDGGFYSLAYIHAKSKPEARIGIHSPTRAETYLVQPADWGNIWVYGMRIYLTGWITREEFRQRAGLLPEGSRVFQYDRTRVKNLAVPVANLRPLPKLLSRARAWAESRGAGGGPTLTPSGDTL